MADASVRELMETLHAQQELLQQLYTELDVEREATATAANESLSMILRLQGEKAAVKMEASQYKRIAEEKMVHAEETLEIFRDLIYQKEMQIASLEFQVQAYRFKLISLGCSDVSETETTYTANMFLRRGGSLPPNFFKDCEDLASNSLLFGESSGKLLPERKDQDLSHGKTYWEQIKKLDERVKQLSNSKDSSRSGNKANEMSNSQLSSNSFYDALKEEITPRFGQSSDHLMDMELSKDPATPAKVYDIFEVPQTFNGSEFANLLQSKQKGKFSPEDGIGPVTPDAIKVAISDDTDNNNWGRRITMSPDINDIFPRSRDVLAMEHLCLKHCDITSFELQEMKQRLKKLEDELIMPRQEITLEKDDDKLLLMKAIKAQLDSIEDEIKGWKPKMSPPKKDVNLTPLAEAMLHFWL